MTTFRAAVPYRAAVRYRDVQASLFVTSAGSNATGLNTVQPTPSGSTTGDMMILFIYWNNGGGATLTTSALTSAGWLQAGSTATDQSLSSAVFWKPAGASETGVNININFSVSAKRTAIVGIWRGPKNVEAISSTAEGASSVAVHTAPNVTTSRNALIINAIGDRGATVWATTGTVAADRQLRRIVSATQAAECTVVLSDGDLAWIPQTTGSTSSTFDQTSPQAIGWTVAAGMPVAHPVTSTGGLVTSGSGAIGTTKQLTATGSGTTSGSAALTMTWAVSASGAINTSGAGPILSALSLASAGQIVTTGTVAALMSHAVSASGTLITSGTSALGLPTAVTASGALTTTGTAALGVTGVLEATGAISTTGEAYANLLTGLTAEGTLSTSGSSAYTFLHGLTAGGELTTSGSAAALIALVLTASGTLVTNGSVVARRRTNAPPIKVGSHEPMLLVSGGRRKVLVGAGREPATSAP